MRRPKLWYYFAVYAVMLVIAYCVGFFLFDFLVIPELGWLFTHQFKWMTFNRWMSSVLSGIPIGLMTAGMLTLNEWLQRTDAPIMKKIVLSAVATTIIVGAMYQMILGINILLPH
jgi:hypothetical protein